MAAKVQLTGGDFQDSMGNVLANGYLTMKLSSDEEVNDALICSGIELRIQLDANGDVVLTPAQSVWGNDVMLPVNSYYTVTGYTEEGQVAWGPNNQQVVGVGPFDTGTWIPNKVVSWVPPLQVPTLEVNGVANTFQTLLDLVDSASVTFANISGGQVQATAVFPPPPTPLALQTNEVPNIDQSLLDLHAGTNITLTDNGSGRVTIDSTAVPPAPDDIPAPSKATFAYWSANASGGGPSVFKPLLDDINFGASGSAGATHNPPSATQNSSVNLSAGSSGNIGLNGGQWFFPTRTLSIRVGLQAHATAGTSFFYAGLSNILAGNAVDPSTGDGIFIAAAQGTFANWLLVSTIGGVVTTVDSLVPIDFNRHQFEIQVIGGTATMFIDGVSTVSTSTLPTANPLAQVLWQQVSGSAQTDVEYLYTTQLNP